MSGILQLAEEYQRKAWQVVKETAVVEIWRAQGAEINLVGSLKTGLLIKHRDIDFHIYSDTVDAAGSFAAAARLAANGKIRKIWYANLLDTPEVCLEWHAWYEDGDKNMWQIDMIHMPKRSTYAGYFERVAERIAAVLTPETRDAILTIKNAVPDDQKVMGIEIYQAVIRDGVRDYAAFLQWRSQHRQTGIITWVP